MNDNLSRLVAIAAEPGYPAAVREYASLFLAECDARAATVLADIEAYLGRGRDRAA
jgi:hypothetical protein